MAIKPKNVALEANSVDILNTIRSNASPQYQALIPEADASTASLRGIGNIMMVYQPLKNEFLSALYNRIARVIITSKMYYNPWAMFKKGLMELGETVEEVFVAVAKGHQYDPDKAATNFMAREIPDVKSAFHSLNYQKFYKATISNDQLRQAFLSWQGITDLIARIVDQMYTAHNYDEFQVMKYMLARAILDGKIKPVTIPEVTKANAEDIVIQVKATAGDMTYENSDYNMAGVLTHTPYDELYTISSNMWNATMSVSVLATAFHMEEAQFIGHRVEIDNFGKIDNARLAELFKDDPFTTFVPLTTAEMNALNEVPAVAVSRDFFMIFDNLYQFTEDYNGEGLYWNYWYHVWKTFSMSPFAQAVLFTPGTPGVTSVTVTPATATVGKGAQLQLNATVVTTAFAPKSIVWSVDSDNSTITSAGLLSVGADETKSSLTVSATSTYDNTKVGTATITVPQA